MDRIEIIKTLPHTQALFIPEKTNSVHTSASSPDLLEFLANIELVTKKDLSFSSLLAALTTQPNSKILDEFRAGEKPGFKRTEVVNDPLEFRILGDSILAWLPGYEMPLRFTFFGETCETIELFDINTNRVLADFEFYYFCNKLPNDKGLLEEISINQVSNKREIKKLAFTRIIEKNDYSELFLQTDFSFPPLFYANTKLLITEIKRLLENGFELKIKTNHKESLPDSLKKYCLESSYEFKSDFASIKAKSLEELPAGFISETLQFAFLTDRELFGNLYLGKAKTGKNIPKNIQKLLRQFEGEVQIGEYVVHEDYGIAMYQGITMEEVSGSENEYLFLEFAESDELLVPITQIQKITRYLSDGGTPKLTKLGKRSWSTIKKKVKADTYALAKDLIEHYAKRELSKANAVAKSDSEGYEAFVADFPFTETPDQVSSINEIISDIVQDVPMNRLLVGDVGFGKTEVALRAAYKIMEEGSQVLFLSPTTILASQHFKTATNRFLGTSFQIGYVSRFNTPSKNREIIDTFNKGDIQMLIGTHRILSSDVQPESLGLAIIDEEQKFGVKQKEKLKKLNYGVHVLSVSATPIPRTLSLALSTIQDISIISSPPKGRNPIETEIIFRDWNKVSSAIEKEVKRGGQVYFIHNRVESISAIREKLERLLPGIKFIVAHGQMNSNKLKKVMTDFHAGKFDCLVATSIIENGLDLSNVNTMIIHDAHIFGLSQLYQLRGRVGRSEAQAYCYLMAPKPSSKEKDKEMIDFQKASDEELLSIAKALDKKENKSKLYMERLEALVNNTTLGSGFAIASKDLELRGAGNILGEKQSGHISTVGYALYIEMLANEIEAQRNLINFEKKSETN